MVGRCLSPIASAAHLSVFPTGTSGLVVDPDLFGRDPRFQDSTDRGSSHSVDLIQATCLLNRPGEMKPNSLVSLRSSRRQCEIRRPAPTCRSSGRFTTTKGPVQHIIQARKIEQNRHHEFRIFVDDSPVFLLLAGNFRYIIRTWNESCNRINDDSPRTPSSRVGRR